MAPVSCGDPPRYSAAHAVQSHSRPPPHEHTNTQPLAGCMQGSLLLPGCKLFCSGILHIFKAVGDIGSALWCARAGCDLIGTQFSRSDVLVALVLLLAQFFLFVMVRCNTQALLIRARHNHHPLHDPLLVCAHACLGLRCTPVCTSGRHRVRFTCDTAMRGSLFASWKY